MPASCKAKNSFSLMVRPSPHALKQRLSMYRHAVPTGSAGLPGHCCWDLPASWVGCRLACRTSERLARVVGLAAGRWLPDARPHRLCSGPAPGREPSPRPQCILQVSVCCDGSHACSATLHAVHSTDSQLRACRLQTLPTGQEVSFQSCTHLQTCARKSTLCGNIHPTPHIHLQVIWQESDPCLLRCA